MFKTPKKLKTYCMNWISVPCRVLHSTSLAITLIPVGYIMIIQLWLHGSQQFRLLTQTWLCYNKLACWYLYSLKRWNQPVLNWNRKPWSFIFGLEKTEFLRLSQTALEELVWCHFEVSGLTQAMNNQHMCALLRLIKP